MSNTSETYIQIRINRNVSIAVLASVLVHILLLYFLGYLLLNKQGAKAQRQTITVNLAPRTPPAAAAPAPTEIRPPEPPRTAHPIRKPEPRHPLVSTPDVPKTLAAVQPPTMPPPTPTLQRPPPPKPATTESPPVTDMMSYVKAAREKRRLAGEDVDRSSDAATQPHTSSEDETRMANIQRNLQPSGTNGIFQIVSMDKRTAMIAFRGWKNEYSYSHREVYEVEAGPNGDIARAIVRKMIEIIRRYYSGNFNWESQRLDRVVVLSARMQDNDGLEDFLLQEFFGSNGISAR